MSTRNRKIINFRKEKRKRELSTYEKGYYEIFHDGLTHRQVEQLIWRMAPGLDDQHLKQIYDFLKIHSRIAMEQIELIKELVPRLEIK